MRDTKISEAQSPAITCASASSASMPTLGAAASGRRMPASRTASSGTREPRAPSIRMSLPAIIPAAKATAEPMTAAARVTRSCAENPVSASEGSPGDWRATARLVRGACA
eukprot:scaffold314023_cov26-Tisochrysis_lutea.AAC.2